MDYRQMDDLSRRNADDNLHAYVRISHKLIRQIESKVWRLGDRIPTEAQLAKEFGVSIGTVRKALEDLVTRGFLRRVQGNGTFVAGSFIRSKNHHFYRTHASFVDAEPERNCVFLGISVLPGEGFICEYLGLEPGTPLLKLERLISLGDTPFVLVYSFFEASRFARLERIEPARFGREALTLILEKEYDMPTMAAHELGCAVAAAPEVAAVLRIPVHAPILYLEMLSFSYDETPYEYRQSFCATGMKLFHSY